MKKYVLILLGIIISNCVGQVLATTYSVNPGQSIQTAIDSASYLDTVEVAAGTYIENITLKNGVRLVGAGASSTTIDGASNGTVVGCSICDPNTRLSGFTVTNGGGDVFGGGMYNVHAYPIIRDCVFSGNSATYGGGMYNWDSAPTIVNCVFSGNSATYGGGMYNNIDCSPMITNCTFSGNFADTGGGMRNYDSNPTITNCIMWQNMAGTSGAEISNNPYSTPTISYSDIEGCGGSAGWDTSFGTDGGGNKDADPLFVRNPNDGGDGWGDDPCTPADESANDDYGDLHLADGSPCIDAGDNNAIIANPLDLDGNPRISNVVVDMGAYERLCICSVTGDFNCSCDVDLADFAILSKAWQSEKGQAQYNLLCDISVPADDIVDIEDAKVFAENWLQGL